MTEAVRAAMEQLESRVYLSLTAGASTRIEAVQFQSLDVGDINGTGAVFVGSGANVTVDSVQDTSLTISGKLVVSSAAVLQNQSRLSTISSLSIPTGGTLDVTNNQLIINYGSGTDPVSTIRGLLTSGLNAGTWTGTGIDSSTAALPANNSLFGLGYADGADGIVAGLSSGQIEVKYTLLGDANLDGVVSGSDFSILVGNLGKSGKSWDQGDFNYDGVVSGVDFSDLVGNLGKSANNSLAASYTIPPQYIATFTDAAGTSLNNISATINWGDGSAPTVGAIVADGGGGSGTFHVIANHDYLEAGIYQTSTTITDNTIVGSPVTITTQGTVVVAPAVFASTLKPVGLTATPLDASQMELTWADAPILNLAGSTGLALDISTSSTFSTVTTQTLNSHVTAFVASGLTASTPYFFRIRSNGVTGAPNSEIATASTKASGSPAAPTITVGAAKTLNANQTAVTLSMTATAPGSDSLSYSWQTVSSPLGIAVPTFSFTGSEQTSIATLFGTGTYVFRGVATDSTTTSASNGLAATSDVVVTVSQITSGVNVTVNNINVAPGVAGVADGDTRQFTATPVDQFGIAMVSPPTVTWSLATTPRSGESVSATGLYHAPNTGTAAGSATVQASAGGFTGTATAVTAPSSTGGAFVSIQAVAGTITQLTPVSIIADSPNDTLSTYSLTLTPMSFSGSAIILASGTTEVGAASSSPVQIASINPDLLQQGTYTLTLSATDASGTPHTTSQTVQIASQLKLGNFNLPVTDLMVNTPGIPLTVSRVYDSTRANENRGDFGPGWLALNDVNFTTSAFNGRGSVNGTLPGGFPALTTLNPGTGNDVFYITLPGGQEDAFQFSPVDSGTQDGAVSGAADFGEIFFPAFKSLNNHDSLTVATSYDNGVQDSEGEGSNSSQINLFISAGDGTYFTNFDGFFDPSLFGQFAYNPAFKTGATNKPSYGGTFVLTTQQGITYTIDGASGRISSEKDLNGNTITFNSPASPTSIVYTPNVAGAASTTITITRSGGHITDILDPNSGDIHYGYNANGDLTSVTQRDHEGTGTRDITSYSYLGTTNLMTQVTDARGANLFTATYGVNGGLSSLTDVFGNPVPIQISPSGSSNSIESTTDLLGNTTEEVYDSNGQLLRTIKQLLDPQNPAVTRFSVVEDQYNDSLSSLITLQSNPFFTDAANQFTAGATATESSPPPNGWQIDRTYDGNGNIITDKDTLTPTLTETTSYSGYISYNDPNGGAVEILGKPSTITDPTGPTPTITNTYDGNGNLLTTTDGTGQETVFDYSSGLQPFAAGQVVDIFGVFSSANKLLSSNTYNSHGQLTSTTDFNYLANGTQSGSVLHSYLYDNNGNQTVSYYFDSANNQTVADRTNYDGDDRMIESRHYVLSGNFSFTSASDFDSHSFTPNTTTSTTYNADGKVASTADEYGGVTFYDYNVKGNLIRTLYPDGTEVRSVYDVLGRLLLQTDRYFTGATSLASPSNTIAARATLYVYDQTGRMKETDRIDGAVVTVGQDPNASVPSGINTAAWNGVGSLISREQTIYNSAGQVGAQVGTDGQTTNYAYFTDGKVKSQTNALGQTTSYAYSVNTMNHTTAIAVTDPNSHTTTTTYDADGRVIGTTYNDGSFIQTTYSQTAAGQTIAQDRQRNTGDTPIETDSKYDINGRLVEVDEPNPTTPTGSSGKLVTTYGYDIYGDETTQMDANGHTTTFTYDSEGRQTGETLPGGTISESTLYDTLGRESQSTDFDGNVTVYDYNNSGEFAGKLADEKFFTPGQSLSSTPNEETADAYNNLGQLSQVTQSSTGTTTRITTYGYDLDGNEISELVFGLGHTPGSNPPDQQLHNVYDQATDRLIETYTGNSVAANATTDIHYGYDDLGRLASVTSFKIDGSTPAAATEGSTTIYNATGGTSSTTLPNTVYTYDAAGNMHTEALPDGITQTYGYDDLNRLTTETVTEGSNNIASFTYSLSIDGKRMNEIDNQYNTSGTLLYTNTFSWMYDGDNRLKSESLVAGSGSPDQSYTDAYTYDSVGNRTQKVHTVGSNVTTITDSYDTNGDDHLMTETATGTGAYSTSYTYDNNGSMKMEIRTGTGAVSNSYTYDVQNHLVSATVGGTTITYAYDADGNRVSSTQGSSTTDYTIDDNNPTGYSQILETAASLGGTPTTTYVVGQAVLGQANSSGVLSYLVTDGHGNTRILADASGGITQRYDFDAFGNALTSITGTQILYSGQFLDSATGLYDLRARNYDPTIGRFTSFDSFSGYISDPSSLQKYVYAGANPINMGDPTGHQTEELIVDIGIDGALEIGHALGSVALGAEEGTFTYEAAEEYSAFIEELADEVGAPRFSDTEAAALDEEASNIAENAANGLQFQRQALSEGGISPETDTFTESINGQDVTTRPDSYEEGVQMTEVKNVNYQPYTKQLQAQIAKARATNTPYRLIIRGGQNATRLSQPLITALRQIGATVLQYNPPAPGFTNLVL